MEVIDGETLQDLGYKVAPFKSQNVSNNSHICDDGRYIKSKTRLKIKSFTNIYRFDIIIIEKR